MRTVLLLAALLVLFADAGRLVHPVQAAPAAAPQSGWSLDIDRAMDVVGIAGGMTVGEAGAGDGYFTLPMARRVGDAGVVYANDISRSALYRLDERARQQHLSNVHTVEGSVDDPKFPRHDLQLVVAVHAFHDFGQPVEWLQNLRKYLSPAGAFAIIDRDPSQGASHHFMPRERILEHAAAAGYQVVKVVDVIPGYIIVVLKP